MRICLAAKDVVRLAEPDAEGVYFHSPDGLRYCVEKDFPCAHPRPSEAAEPTSSTFPPPPGFAERKAG